MYANARSHVHVSDGYSEEFEMKVGVHQGSYSAPFSSSLCLKAYQESSFLGSPGRTFMPMLSSLNCSRNVTWKKAMEKKGLRVNAGKIMICSMGLDLLQSSGEFPCTVCHTGVSSNSIFCNGCKHWVH